MLMGRAYKNGIVFRHLRLLPPLLPVYNFNTQLDRVQAFILCVKTVTEN